MLTEEELKAWRELCEKAKRLEPGFSVVCGDCNVRINPGSGINLNKTECWVVGPPVSSSLHARSHVDFHDAAVSAMPRLLDEVERLRKEVQSWTDEAARYCENSVYWQDKYEAILKSKGINP